MDSPSSAYLGMDDFPIYALGPVKTAWQYSKKLLPWLLENITRFDVVIVNGLWLYHGYAVRKALQQLSKQKSAERPKERLPKRVLVMAHGMLDPYFQRAQGRKLKAIRNWVYWKLIESKLVNYCDGVLFTCETELRLARHSFRPYRPKRELNIGYGIKEPPLYNTAMRDKFLEKCPNVKGVPYFLFISRIHSKKGVDLLIKAYINFVVTAEANTEIPKLVIAGPGINTPYGRELVKLADGFSNLIFFPGMLSGDSKWGAFNGCNAFILPSHQENFGIAVVEALACSKPVLISNQVNICNEVKSEGGGLVEEDTLQGTKELLQTWANMSNDEKLEMSMNARFCYERNFNIVKVSVKLFEAISC